jgi:DNA-binding transcriptional MerR regulator
MLLKIQDFAEFCGLSVRALHLYDKIGLFTPNTTDKSNGYRYYDTEQMKDLYTILSLKKVGMSLKDIAELKKNNYSLNTVISKLEEVKKENLRQIEFLTYNNKIMDDMLSDLGKYNSESDIDEKHLTKIICMDNDKLEDMFSQILWL